ncbi:hypothetical protein [Allostreptomyces psammosilenae]|uniref:Lipoprotein n=1 Tax=Allostreptomyces psammosilenae TaxID=1892865 RepID=A0A852ZZU9_9ACTN|nr:hypothetical protein [Allostreptomyces psammosilenae]NYI06204.1 hypothetical protein [Allostreptomyces psammosilenae]
MRMARALALFMALAPVVGCQSGGVSDQSSLPRCWGLLSDEDFDAVLPNSDSRQRSYSESGTLEGLESVGNVAECEAKYGTPGEDGYFVRVARDDYVNRAGEPFLSEVAGLGLYRLDVGGIGGLGITGSGALRGTILFPCETARWEGKGAGAGVSVYFDSDVPGENESDPAYHGDAVSVAHKLAQGLAEALECTNDTGLDVSEVEMTWVAGDELLREYRPEAEAPSPSAEAVPSP